MKKLLILFLFFACGLHAQYVTPVNTSQWFKKTAYFGSDTLNTKIKYGNLFFGTGGQYLGKGSFDRGGNGGISNYCAVGYENNWQVGSEYIYDNNGYVRVAQYKFNTPPDANTDGSQKYIPGSYFILDNGDTYVCTDSTTGAAVWSLFNSGAGWSLTGNAGTTQGTNKIGTTDLSGLDIATNDTARIVIDGTGTITAVRNTPSGTGYGLNLSVTGEAYLIAYPNGATRAYGIYSTIIGTALGSISGATSTDLFIDSSGYVGIGTATPANKLDVVGSFKDSVTVGGTDFLLANGATNITGTLQAFVARDNVTGDVNAITYDTTNNRTNIAALSSIGDGISHAYDNGAFTASYLSSYTPVNTYTHNSTGWTFMDGNVGIGIEPPTYQFEVQSLEKGSNFLLRGTNTAFGYDATIECGTTPSGITITASYPGSANTIINRTTPNSWIAQKTDSIKGNASIAVGITGVTVTGFGISNQTAFTIVDSLGNENFTILSNGNTGIKTTTPTEKLEVAGSVKLDSALIIAPNVPTDTAYTIPNNVSKVAFALSGTFATGTITLPSTPKEGQHLDIYIKTGEITALTINTNGMSFNAGYTPPTTLNGNTTLKLYFTDGYWLNNQ